MKQILYLIAVLVIAASCSSTKHLPTLTQERKIIADTLLALPVQKIVPDVFFMVPGSYELASIEASDALLESRYYPQILEAIDSIYSIRQFVPLWLNYNRGYREICEEALVQLQSAHLHGLHPEDYQSTAIQKMLIKALSSNNADPETFKQIELTLTAHYLLFNYDLIKGRVNPYKISYNWFLIEKDIHLIHSLAAMGSAKGLKKHLKAVVPASEHYNILAHNSHFIEN